jgi:UDP-N-acetyl-D-glucosamine dehydrogenase
MSNMAKRVVVVGQGYVGLPLAMRAVEAGYDVVGFDTDVRRIKGLADGQSFTADVSSEQVRAALSTGRYQATDDVASCDQFDIAVITVPTPLREGIPDLSYVVGAASTLADYLRVGATVILESTTYPGTTDQLVAPILEKGSDLIAGKDFFLGYSPERIDPGNEVWTFTTTPKLVSGINAASLEHVQAFYGTLVDTVVPVKTTSEAELAKLIENTFRHVNVALVNELAVYAADLGIDVWGSIDAASSKPFGFMRFTPGPGVGGHCLPIDPSYLSWTVKRRLGRQFRFIELANDVNEHMPNYVVERVVRSLNHVGVAVSRSKILVLGLAYKRNTSDARESPAVTVAMQLAAGGAELLLADPHVSNDVFDRIGGSSVALTAEMIQSADLVVMLTEHDSFDLDLVRTHAKRILDTRHCLEGPHVEYL